MSDVISRRLQTSPTALAYLPDELHAEILLRLPSQHHCLLRASQVCRLWRHLVAHPEFLRSFRARHIGTLPLIGVFHDNSFRCVQRFTPTGEEPSAVGIFHCRTSWRILDCRHGRVLFLGAEARAGRSVLFVWDPMTGSFEAISMPPDWTVCDYDRLNGAVVCTASDDAGDQHGDCRSSQFLVVLLIGREPRALVSVYSSESGKWSQATSYDGLPMWADIVTKPSVVFGNTLYQPLLESHTLSFYLESRSFAVIPHPPETSWMDVQIMRSDGGVLGLVVADNVNFALHLWAREDTGDWVLRRTVKLDTLQPLAAVVPPGAGNLRSFKLLRACDYGNVIFLGTRLGTYMFHLKLDAAQEAVV